MADIDENLQTFIEGITALSGIHVGQEIPEDIDFPFVFLIQAGEATDDDLCATVTATQFDVEVYSTDVEQCRDLTNAIKADCRAMTSWSATFEGNVQFISIVDHDDNYQRKLSFDQTNIHSGNLFVELHH